MQINKDLIIEDKSKTLGNVADTLNNHTALLTPTVLYDGGGVNSGTTGNVTLTDDWDKYTYIEIFYTRAEYELQNVKVPTDLAGTTYLPVNAVCCFYGYGTGFWIGWKQFRFMQNNKKRVEYTNGNWYTTSSSGAPATNNENTIKCLRILGWK